MNRYRFLMPLVAILAVLLAVQPTLGAATGSAVVEAIKRDYCFWDYWGFNDPRPALTLPVAVRVSGDTAYAWIEGLHTFPRGRMASYYQVATKDGRSGVAYTLSYNIELMQQTFDFKEKKNRIFGGQFEMLELRIPKECMLLFEPDTPAKLHAVNAVAQAMVEHISSFNKNGGANFPKRTRIVIGNFNLDDPEAFVLVRDTGEVFNLVLHDPPDPLGDGVLKSGDFPFGQIYRRDQVAVLTKRIVAVGIEREIELTD